MTTTPQDDWEKEFWILWGISPEGTPKHKAGLKALGIVLKARNETLDEAKKIIKTWHIKKGGFSEIEYRIEQLKFK